MVILIVAADENGIIGNSKTNMIPWMIPDELRHFKDVTTGHNVVMGNNTWQSIPKRFRPLSQRVNYVISRQNIIAAPHKTIEESLCGPIFCKSLPDALNDADKNFGKKTFIIGGEEIYKVALEMMCVDLIILSRVKGTHEGDKFFHVPPNFQQTSIERREGFDILHFEPIE